MFLLLTSPLRASDDEVVTERFYTSSAADMISLTHSGSGLFAPFPADIPTFNGPSSANGFMVNVFITDDSGKTVGFATEQEELFHGGVEKLNYSDWSIKIPGRGALFVTKVEKFNWLFAAIEEMADREELEKTFDPPLERWTTVPGTGKIIGGTGEFEGAEGEFREFNRFHSISLLTGINHVEVVLEIKIHMDDDDHDED